MSTFTFASFCRISNTVGIHKRFLSTCKSAKYHQNLSSKLQNRQIVPKRILFQANSRAGSKAKALAFGTSLAFLGFGAAKDDKSDDKVTKKYKLKEENVEDRIHYELVKAEVIRGMVQFHKEEYEDAAETLQKSLDLSNSLFRDNLITEVDNLNHRSFIHNTLANNAYKLRQYDTAMVNFKECMKECVRLGMARNDNAIIDMSIKLAVSYNYLQNYEFAKDGFRYSILEQQKKVDADPDADDDTFALLGIAYEEYGRFYLQKNYFIDGETLLLKALDICKKVMGENDDQCLRIMNDIATCSVMQAKYDEAEKLLKEGIKLGQKSKSLMEVAFRSNLGAVYLRQEKYNAAEHECQTGLNIALKAKEVYFQTPCMQCLEKVKQARHMTEGEKLRKSLREAENLKAAN